MEKLDRKAKIVTQYAGHVVLSWAPVVVWMVVIFFLSSRQRIAVSTQYVLNFLFFKTLHVLEYSVLYLLTFRAVHLTYRSILKRTAIVAFFIVFLYAASDELHQMYVPTREGTLRDVIIDGIGAGVIWYFLCTQLPTAPKKLKDWAHALGLIS